MFSLILEAYTEVPPVIKLKVQSFSLILYRKYVMDSRPISWWF